MTDQSNPSYASRVDQLKAEWSSKNAKSLDDYTRGSGFKAVWVCQLGHEWEASIVKRIKGSNCPFCGNRRVLAGFNDLATTHPILAKDWHPTKNLPLTPSMVTGGSDKKVWWQCEKGHEWEAAVYERAGVRRKATGCPFCAGNRVISGVTDLASTHPELAKEWSPKNVLQPTEVSAGSETKVGWICPKGHEYEARIYSRTSKNSPRGCPICAGRKVKVGETDLATVNKHLASEWHPTKNLPLTSESVTARTGQRIWWQCPEGHEWEATPNDRHNTKTTKGYTSCPYCVKSSSISKAEQEIVALLREYGLEVAANVRNVISPFELDMYLPENGIAIEYNGLYWHTESRGKDKWYHHKKWAACKEKGIQLIQIWEDDWNRNPDLVKRMLAHKLGVGKSEPAIFARKTTIRPVTKTQADEFLNRYHIQGTVNGSIRIGLWSDNLLVALTVLRFEPGSEGTILNLLRFATARTVPGGFTKLIRHIQKTMPKVNKIITFSDNSVSDGGLYEDNGFVAVKQLDPDYTYLVGSERKHKFGYRLQRFRTDPNLLYEEGTSESQLAELNGLDRIWDAGKTKWEYQW